MFYTNVVSQAFNHSTNARKLDLLLSNLFITGYAFRRPERVRS